MTTPLRFCMVTTFYPPYNFGGDGITVRRLVRELALRGHSVDVVHCRNAFRLVNGGPPDSSEYDEPANVTVHGLETRAGWLSPLITQQTGGAGLKRGPLKRVLGRPYDVIHFHNASLIGLGALAYGNAVKLYTMHEHWLVCPMHVLWKFDRRPCERKQCVTCSLHARRPPQLWRTTGRMRRLLRPVDAFIAPSHFTRAKHLEWGLRVDVPIVPIPNFLPEPAVDSDAPPPERPYYVYGGRLERMKGVEVLLEAFARHRSADLIIAGTGTDEARLRRLGTSLPHVQFLGHIPYERLSDLLRGAVAAVVPSVGYEVFPTAVVEAFAHGTPVIAHHFGPLPEMVSDTGGGLTYRDLDGLRTALRDIEGDPGLRKQLARRARETYLANWTPERHLEQYFDLIATIGPGDNIAAPAPGTPVGSVGHSRSSSEA